MMVWLHLKCLTISDPTADSIQHFLVQQSKETSTMTVDVSPTGKGDFYCYVRFAGLLGDEWRLSAGIHEHMIVLRLYSPSPIQVLWGSGGYENPRLFYFSSPSCGMLPEACLKWKIRKKAKAVASLQKQLGKSHDMRCFLQSREGMIRILTYSLAS